MLKPMPKNIKDYCFGYKVVNKENYTVCYPTKLKRSWIHSDYSDYPISTAISHKQTYKRGFHIFTNKKSAMLYRGDRTNEKVVKVQYKNIVAYGEESITHCRTLETKRANVVVAQSIRMVKS
jgi:hypothetical protein